MEVNNHHVVAKLRPQVEPHQLVAMPSNMVLQPPVPPEVPETQAEVQAEAPLVVPHMEMVRLAHMEMVPLVQVGPQARQTRLHTRLHTILTWQKLRISQLGSRAWSLRVTNSWTPSPTLRTLATTTTRPA